jgi:hypothetical protein
LKDSKDELQREKDRTCDKNADSGNLQMTVNKLLMIERQNEELRLMHGQMKDQMKKDLFTIDKKYKKA